ncbi:hypothetical protein TVAG_067550 [Trichomonas vaginalis G3]|uniref:Uncharacterized protein n=1 Tax=Trichomonas vaginalis (strain ATCC PRA-98 / G3) TaxID=412133 RepID=A2DSH1_TRIV3|nr:hypothetical protein TVAG_067550 [Trichomonas vaginalis G3]|eukprot:XP_001328973.1 hypothetical protein [Trichomonas vaginalis G3]
MKEAEERKKALAEATQDNDETMDNPNDSQEKRQRKRRHRRIQYVTVIKKRINKETGREETYEEQIAVPTSDEEPSSNSTPSSPRKSSAKHRSSARPSNAKPLISDSKDNDDESDSESSEDKSRPKTGGGKRKPKKIVKKTTVIKKQRKPKTTKAGDTSEPETQVIRVKKRRDPKKVVQQVVTVIKKHINPNTGKEELVEEKVPIELSESSSSSDSIDDQIFFDQLKKKTNSKAHRNTTAGLKNSKAASRRNSTARRPSTASRRPSTARRPIRRGSTSNIADLMKKSSPQKVSRKSSAATASLINVEPIDSLLIQPKSGRRRRTAPIEKIITEIVLESDDEGERKPVQRQKTIIEEYYSDYSEPEADFSNIKVFVSDDEDDNMVKKLQRDIPALLSRID